MIVVVAGVLVAIVLHFVSPQSMPWWPDTISLGIAFGVAAAVVAAKFKKDRDVNRRIWSALKRAFRSV